MENNLPKVLVAEFIGTFALIFIGAGAVALDIGGLLGAAFAHGFVVFGFIYSYGHISGTHINPAVTVGLLLAKQIDAGKAVAYICSQLVGGIAGALALRFVLGGSSSGLGTTHLAEGVSLSQGLAIEAILTFFLVNAVFNAAVSGKAGNMAGAAVSMTLISCILMGGPLTGASLNPARTLGPAVATGDYALLWLYFLGPILGAIAAALAYNAVLKE